MSNNRQLKERKFWDKYAYKYDRFIDRRVPSYGPMMKKLLSYVDESKDVLEIATGTGLIALKIAPHCKKVYACDISEPMIQVSKEKQKKLNISNIEFTVQDAYDLTYEKDFFDVVIASNTLHIMIHPDKALSSIFKVLKRDGILIAPTICHGVSLKTKFLSSFISLFGFKAYHKWSIESFKEFLESNNYKIIEFELIKDTMPMAFAVAKKTDDGL
jgi:ubiquinone/menaquinone biosynthesis C-methylase UbiE